jgi:hypothetical protein
MSVLRLICISALALAPAACASDGIFGSAGGLSYAAATRTCGPADGPGTAIYLSPAPVDSLPPPAPYVLVDIWQPLDRLTDRTWVLGGSDADGGAAYYSSAGEYEVAEGGRVRVSSVASDGTLTGSTLLDFPRSGRLRSDFHAVWIPRAVLCG